MRHLIDEQIKYKSERFSFGNDKDNTEDYSSLTKEKFFVRIIPIKPRIHDLWHRQGFSVKEIYIRCFIEKILSVY